MNIFEAAVIIVVFAIIASVIKNKQTAKMQKPYRQPEHNKDANTEQMQAQILELKKRVETLEAIVTDKSYNLKREIDDL